MAGEADKQLPCIDFRMRRWERVRGEWRQICRKSLGDDAYQKGPSKTKRGQMPMITVSLFKWNVQNGCGQFAGRILKIQFKIIAGPGIEPIKAEFRMSEPNRNKNQFWTWKEIHHSVPVPSFQTMLHSIASSYVHKLYLPLIWKLLWQSAPICRRRTIWAATRRWQTGDYRSQRIHWKATSRTQIISHWRRDLHREEEKEEQQRTNFVKVAHD